MDELFEGIFEGLVELLRARFSKDAKAGRVEGEKELAVSRDGLMARANDYRVWATAHGLVWSGQKNHEYMGTYGGVGMELTTGIGNAPKARSPSLYLRYVLAAGDPTLDAVRAVPGVWKVILASDLVQVRFDPCVEPAVFDAALAAISSNRRWPAP